MHHILKNGRQVGWVVGFTLSILMFVIAEPIAAQTAARRCVSLS